MTSYGGIIRIRLKGRSSITSSQPAFYKLPCIYFFKLYTHLCQKTRGVMTNYMIQQMADIFALQDFFPTKRKTINPLLRNPNLDFSTNTKKGLDFSVEALVSSAISFRLPPASFSAAASSGSPLSSAFASDFLWAVPSASFRPLPFRFLTPAVFAFFRPLQFWVLTTQPLLFLSFSSRFRLAAAFPVPVSAFASSVSPFFPT